VRGMCSPFNRYKYWFVQCRWHYNVDRNGAQCQASVSQPGTYN
jgi:hypothetical protein